MIKTCVAIVLVAGALALAGCGSSASSCETACNKIYDQCKVTLTQGGVDVPKGQCVSLCNQTGNPGSTASCVNSKQCNDTNGIAACFSAPAPGGCGGACATIYNTCSLILQDTSGNQLTEAQCTTVCQQSAKSAAIPGCVNAAQCDSKSVVACFQ